MSYNYVDLAEVKKLRADLARLQAKRNQELGLGWHLLVSARKDRDNLIKAHGDIKEKLAAALAAKEKAEAERDAARLSIGTLSLKLRAAQEIATKSETAAGWYQKKRDELLVEKRKMEAELAAALAAKEKAERKRDEARKALAAPCDSLGNGYNPYCDGDDWRECSCDECAARRRMAGVE